MTANQATAPLASFSLRHVSKPAGTPDDIITELRNLPLPVCLHKFGMYDTACGKEVFWIVRAGLTALPHVNGNDIGTNCRLIAVYRDIVPGQKMLRSFKTSEAFLVACADFLWSDQRCSIRTRHFGFCRKDGGKIRYVKSLLIECAKIAMHHTRDFRLVDQLSDFERDFIHAIIIVDADDADSTCKRNRFCFGLTREGAQQALEVFVNAVARNDPRTRHLYFDATTLGEPPTPDNAQRWATAIRRLATRVLFGSDATTAVTTPGGAWAAMRKLLPLTEDEFKGLANNTPPYLQ